MPPPRIEQLTRKLKRAFTAQKPIRTGSLIVTVFGDSVAPRGGRVWLGSLIRAFEDIGIDQRLVRTAVYRLVQDDILINEAIGRRSYYSLTSNGKRQFEEATQRIYSNQHRPWDGQWYVALIAGVDSSLRPALRRDLSWLGFGSFGTDVMAHPNPDRANTHKHLDLLEVRNDVVLLNAQLPADASDYSLQQLVSSAWDLEGLEAAYAQFIETFRPMLAALQQNNDIAPTDAFFIRTFLIHEYRKVLLRDPALPVELLPGTWKGDSAYRLCQEMYAALRDASEAYVEATFENEVGVLPKPAQAFFRRFAEPG